MFLAVLIIIMKVATLQPQKLSVSWNIGTLRFFKIYL